MPTSSRKFCNQQEPKKKKKKTSQGREIGHGLMLLRVQVTWNLVAEKGDRKKRNKLQPRCQALKVRVGAVETVAVRAQFVMAHKTVTARYSISGLAW